MQQASAAGQAKPDAAALFQYALGTEDDPIFPRMHEAAAARAVWTGTAEHGEHRGRAPSRHGG